MKVDPQLNSNFDPTIESTRQTDRVGGAAGSGPGGTTPISDQVTLSPDVQLANAALQAATNASDIRPEAVARAKALLNDGQVGTNLDSLASKLIDSMLKP